LAAATGIADGFEQLASSIDAAMTLAALDAGLNVFISGCHSIVRPSDFAINFG
jgi:hypothetical protein